MLDKFEKFLREDGGLIFLLLILNSTPIIIAFSYTGEILFKPFLIEGISNFYFGAVMILIFCAAIHFGLKNFPRAKFSLQMLILVGFAISFAVDIFLILTFKMILHQHFVEILFATNLNEAKEFLQMYVLNLKIICAVLAFVFIIAAAVKKFQAIFKNLPEKNLRRICNYSLIMLLPFAGIFFTDNLNQVALQSTIFGRNLSNIYTTVKIFGSESEIIAEMKNSHEKIISDDSKIPYVVFVLGEAESRKHMQIYGYNLETTPLAVQRYERGELFKFNDVIACANDTSAAMKLIFTFAEKNIDAENWYKTGNIFEIVHRAGYHTAWISNQSLVGWMGNLDKIYAEICDEKYFADAEKNPLTRDFDEILLPTVDEFISRAHDKNFYCVHLYGSHPTYNKRYPAEFVKFTAEDETLSKKIIAQYDNSILYTDYILDEIFKRFEDKNALIIYISDHGQEIFENEKNFAGHSAENVGSLGMIEIPFLIWTSQKFRENYPKKISALKNSADNPYRTDLIIYTILDLMDIHTENFDAAKSIVNEKFDKNRPRIYNNKPYNKN